MNIKISTPIYGSMSYPLQKDVDGRILKKTLTQGATLQDLATGYSVSNTATLFNEKNYQASLSSVNGVTLSAQNIDYLNSTSPAEPNKAVIPDSSNNVVGVNKLSCKTITANGVLINPTLTGASAAPANDYFSANTSGVATANKVALAGANSNFTGVKKLQAAVTSAENISFSRDNEDSFLFSAPLNLSSSQWRDVVYSVDLKKFLAVGNLVTALSTNGSSWVENVQTISFKSVIWVNHKGKFFAVATNGVYSSVDGVDWTLEFTATGVNAIAAGNSIIIAVGTTTRWSAYNATWSVIAAATQEFRGIAHNGTYFVAVGTDLIRTSTDAANPTWATVTTPQTGQWESVAYGNGQFMAVSLQASNTNKFTVSKDGSIWTPAVTWLTTENELNSGWFKVKFLEDRFYCLPLVTNPSETQIYHTKDSTEWFRFRHNHYNHIAGIAWDNVSDRLLLLTRGTDVVTTPAAYLNLRRCKSQYSRNTAELTAFNAVDYIPETKMLFACGQETLYYSPDGELFSQCNFPYNSGNLVDQVARRIYQVAYSPTLQLYIAASAVSAGVYSGIAKSTNGITWTDVNFSTQVLAVAWSPSHSKFLAITSSAVLHSSDGDNWLSITSAGSVRLSVFPQRAVVFNTAGLYEIDQSMNLVLLRNNSLSLGVITLASGTYYSIVSSNVYTSSDLVTWTLLVNLVSTTNANLVYHEGLDAIVAFRSTDVAVFKNSTWTYNTCAITPRLGRACYDQERQSVYIASSFAPTAIARTVSTRGSTSFRTKNKIYRTLPSAALISQEIADSILTSFSSGTYSFTGPALVSRIFYSKADDTLVGFRTTPSTNPPLYTTNLFRTSQTVGLISSYYIVEAFNSSNLSTYWVASNGTSSQVYTIASPLSSSPVFRFNPFVLSETVKFKKMYKSNIVYYYTKGFHAFGFHNAGYVDGSLGKGGIQYLYNYSSLYGTSDISYVDYVANYTGDEIVAISSTRAYKYSIGLGQSELADSVVLPVATYYQIEFIAGVYVLTSSLRVSWSQDGLTWNSSNLSGLSLNTFSMSYVSELDMLCLVSTGVFAYTKDGMTWTSISAPNKAWTSFVYYSSRAVFVLYASSDTSFFVTSPVMATLENASVPTGGWVDGSTLTFAGSAMNVVADNSPKFGMEVITTPGRSLLMTGSSRSMNISYADGLTFVGSEMKFKNTSAEANPFRYKGNSANINSRAWASLASAEFDGKQRASLVKSVGNNFRLDSLECTSLSAGTLPSNNIAGPVIANSLKNASIKTLGTKELKIGNTSIVSSTSYAPRTWTVHDYMQLKHAKFGIGNSTADLLSTVADSAYSPELDTIVILGFSNVQGSLGQTFYISKDKGVSWTMNTSITSSITTAMPNEQYMRRIIWCPANMHFVAAGNSFVWYSPNGYTWTSTAVSFGTRSHIFYDSKVNRLVVAGASKVAWTPDVNDLTNWTLSAYTPAVLMMEYSPLVDRYVYVPSSAVTTINQATDIYQSTLTGTNMASVGVNINSLLIANNAIYYTTASSIFKAVNTTLNSATTLYSGSSIRRLCNIPELNTLVAFALNSVLYSTNETQWANIPNSSLNVFNPSSGREGISNNVWFTGDRVQMIMVDSGEFLESDIFQEKLQTTPEYLLNLIENKKAMDPLLNSRKENNMLYMKHSSVSRNLYATAYGNNLFVTVGSGGNLYTNKLLLDHTWVAHTGEWRDVVFYNSMFIKVGNGLVSTSSDGANWTDSNLAGNWERLLMWGDKYVIASSTVIMYSANLTNWTDITPPGTVNGIKLANNLLFALSNDNIYTKSEISQAWSTQALKGTWFDIEYAKNLYVIAGDGMMARGRELFRLRRSFVPRRYHRVIYVRLFSDFFLMSKDVFYDNIPNYNTSSQLNAIIRTFDGTEWSCSLNIGQSNTAQALYLSNLHYFEESDQFFIPLNNSGNKIYITSQHAVANKSMTKITTPSCFNTRNKNGTTPCIDIARNLDFTTTSPGLFNVFQDSAAKPSTSTWLTTSDQRLKEDIVDADLDKCYQNISNLPLKYYKWKDEYISKDKTQDRHKLGWIAQDVEQYIPKAVNKSEMFGYEDCRTLDSDQIIANMYGAVQMLIKKIQEKEDAVKEAQA